MGGGGGGRQRRPPTAHARALPNLQHETGRAGHEEGGTGRAWQWVGWVLGGQRCIDLLYLRVGRVEEVAGRVGRGDPGGQPADSRQLIERAVVDRVLHAGGGGDSGGLVVAAHRREVRAARVRPAGGSGGG